MRHASHPVEKGALSATTVFIIVSVLMSLLSMGVGIDMVLGSFIDLATTTDRKWVDSKITSNVESMCNNNQDGVLPEDRNFTREFNRIEAIERERYTYRESLSFFDDDNNERFDVVIQEAENEGPGNIQWDCNIGLNTTLSYNSGSPEKVSGIDNEKEVKFRIFSGSSVQGSEDVIIQVRQEG